ncbi:class I SAM-dependent methyltransferase [Acidithiobacillus concretivorus]|uniref:Class I SAM-dependent methyltransferase n=1 Tax=Acidithiobacillus concretivorus TaxID=3063952 RepID=A0ABS5ZRF8_9PROT|nr:class I SAM-dependent methyltransferase [Acidithiobacillus concretivorus]MBU2739266.1 class I SAM-dependent methyltransferase [Acidithiobacillus concretivorus]
MTLRSMEELRQQAQGAQSLNIAFIGVVNGLFSALHQLQKADSQRLAQQTGMDAGYVTRWCDAAYAFGWLELNAEDQWQLSEDGDSMRPEASGSRMATAIGSVLSAHMAERAAGLMRTGERPGEKVLAERETILPWFGLMLENNFRKTFEEKICPQVPIFAEVDARGGLAVDLGCGNGWYLRALAQRCNNLRGLGLDGFAENVRQAQETAQLEGLGDRLHFSAGDIHAFSLPEPADLIAMNRALHHVWEKRGAIFEKLRSNLKAGGAVVIWEPAWPDDHRRLREAPLRGMAYQNLTEHVQGNHFLHPEEIASALKEAGLRPEIFPFGSDVMVVGRC